MASLICSILAVLMLFSLASLTPPTYSTNNTDYYSLLAFKNALSDPFGALSSWNDQTQFCSWKGIRCSRRHPDRIVAINLTSQGLMGFLSPSIGNMSFLRAINLQNNSFNGVIPKEIGHLRRLEHIKFSNNSFSGGIPRNLSQCLNLLYLDLIDNHLSGTIPLELGSLYKIKNLALAKNNLSGHVPPFIGNLTSLIQLSLTECNLIGEIPESLGQLKNLKYIIFYGNNLTGQIPHTLFNISSILVLSFDRNQLNGSIPSTIGLTLPNLIELFLGDNQFSGAVPISISNASSLEHISLFQNKFSGPMPMLGSLLHLRNLDILTNPIQDDINFISQLVNCTNLKILKIGDNHISGALPESMANFSSNLWALYIRDNHLNGNIPSGIGNLVGLNDLSLANNNLDSFIPFRIGELSNLHRLNLDGNRFSGGLPYSFGNLSSLNDMSLRRSQLSGSIPKSLGHCKSLLSLDLLQNNLIGAIPPELMNLSSVSMNLDLSFNALTNSLPSEIGSLAHLSSLYLSNNRLSGVIPNSLSSCTSLVLLDLEGNLFEGEIPRGLSALKGLNYLDLSRNNFSGLIPSFLGQLHLEGLNLSFNRLEGEVLKFGVFANKTAISLEGNKDLCGGIPELKLPPCPLPSSNKKKLSTLLKILIPIGVVLFLSFGILVYKKRNPKRDLPSSPSLTSSKFLRLSYADLRIATNEFSETNLVGVGRFGSVYKGTLNDGETLIAAKVLNLLVQGASKSFMKECNVLRYARHRNLLKILSVCESIDFKGNNFKALVYEFKDNGNLEKWLHENMESKEESGIDVSNLGIIQRLNIAIDVAHALEYLHCGTESIIVHGDLKPSNILLDHDMTAYVGDFGLAKVISNIIPTHECSSSIGIKGTIGYVPPEYSTGNVVLTEGDVYSYGILLLEIFTNRRPTDDVFKDQWNLHNFVVAALPDNIEEIVDPLVWTKHDINDEKVKDCLASIFKIGVVCSKENPKDRMSMTNVVHELHKIKHYYFP